MMLVHSAATQQPEGWDKGRTRPQNAPDPDVTEMWLICWHFVLGGIRGSQNLYDQVHVIIRGAVTSEPIGSQGRLFEQVSVPNIQADN